jgi:hypothetical protein
MRHEIRHPVHDCLRFDLDLSRAFEGDNRYVVPPWPSIHTDLSCRDLAALLGPHLERLRTVGQLGDEAPASVLWWSQFRLLLPTLAECADSTFVLHEDLVHLNPDEHPDCASPCAGKELGRRIAGTPHATTLYWFLDVDCTLDEFVLLLTATLYCGHHEVEIHGDKWLARVVRDAVAAGDVRRVKQLLGG